MAGDEEIKPPQGAYVSTGVYDDREALTRAADLPEVDESAVPSALNHPNQFSLNADAMVKMCAHCGFLHRDYRENATPLDSSLCAKCVAKGIEEFPRFVA